MTRILTVICTVLFLVAVSAPPIWAGAGHDHGVDHDGETSSPMEVPRLESVGTELELVAVVIDGELIIYVDESATNTPVDDATIEISGDEVPPSIATQTDSGTYALNADWVLGSGTRALTFVVTAGDRIELLNGVLDLGAAREHEDVHSNSLLARPMVWVISGLAALLGFLLAFAVRPHAPAQGHMEDGSTDGSRPKLDAVTKAKHAAQLIFVAFGLAAMIPSVAIGGVGHDHGTDGHAEPGGAGGYVPHKLPNGEVFMPKPSQRLLNVRTTVAKTRKTQIGEELLGAVIADPASEGRVQAPMDGEIELVGKGVAFVGERVQAGAVLAYLVPSMPVYERGYLEQLTAEVEGDLRITRQRLERLQGVRGNYVAQKDLEDTLAELEALRERKRVLEPKSAQRIALEAPVDGIISVANVRAGQVVDARDTLFEIVDPEDLWIEAVGVSGRDYSDVAAAHAVLGEGASFPIKHVGSAPTLRHQARPLYFEVKEPDAAMAIGTKVRVVVQTGTPIDGFVLPETAVVRGANGLEQIWLKVSAEQFRAQPVRTQPLGRAEVLVTGGLEAGSRVVVSGSEFVNQVR